MLFSEDILHVLKQRLFFVVLVILFFFLLIVARLFWLQVVEGEKYLQWATEVVVREEEIIARRGQILDRRGRVLAETRVYHEITIRMQYVSDLQKVVDNLVKIIPLNKDDVLAKIRDNTDPRRYHPIVIAEDVGYDMAARLGEYLKTSYDDDTTLDLSGIEVNAFPVRHYLYPDLFSHVLGYMREISKDQIADKQNYPEDVYSRGDLIGASGLEKQYDSFLKGRDGLRALVVDARGREVPFSEPVQIMKETLSVDPVLGFHLKTTLDLAAQQAAKDSFPKDKKGAVVAIDPRNGEVLVLYSHPGFDTNRFSKIIDQNYWRELTQNKAFYNLATQGEYPPASTYKPVGIVAGLHEKKIDPVNTKVTCHGGMQFGNRFFKCWKAGGHGVMDAVTALGQSCDTYFYKLGLEVGVAGLARVARLFGFDQKTGIDLPSERSGHIPDPQNRKNLQPSDVLSLVIGQSYNLVTPLQLSKMAAMIANGGYNMMPHLAAEIIDVNHNIVQNLGKDLQKTELVDDPAMDWVKKGMIEVVHGFGTAKKLQNSPYAIAGKTGTAQVMQFDAIKKVLIKKENHGLFVGFAPYDNPRIAVAVVVEHGGGGSAAAAPVAKAVIEAYLEQEVDVVKMQKK